MTTTRTTDEQAHVAHKLAPDRADGRACIDCGAEDGPMVPTGGQSGMSAQLFRCVDCTRDELQRRAES